MNSFSLQGRQLRIINDEQYWLEKSKEQAPPSIETVGYVDYKTKKNNNSIENVCILIIFNFRVV